MNIDQQLEACQNRRMAAEHKYLVRREKLEKKAEALIGELQREDGITYYINLAPLSKGKIKESKSFGELIDYLIRNQYV